MKFMFLLTTRKEQLMTSYNRNYGYMVGYVDCDGVAERCEECDNEVELCGGHIGQLPGGARPGCG